MARLQLVSLFIAVSLLTACSKSGSDALRLQAAHDAAAAGNLAEAYCIWKPLAEAGQPEAQYSLGWMYANGDAVNLDVAEAIGWWERAAAHGHVDAQYALATAYATGEGGNKDRAKAVQWYLAASRNGHEEARHIIRKMAGDRDPLVAPAVHELLRKGGDWLGEPVRLSADKVNVRTAPGTKNEIIATLAKDTEVIEIRREGKWSSVGLPGLGQTGWVLTRLLEPKRDLAGAQAVLDPP